MAEPGYKRSFSTVDEMLEYIQEAHEEYMKQPGSVENDCKYITTGLLQGAGIHAAVCRGSSDGIRRLIVGMNNTGLKIIL